MPSVKALVIAQLFPKLLGLGKSAKGQVCTYRVTILVGNNLPLTWVWNGLPPAWATVNYSSGSTASRIVWIKSTGGLYHPVLSPCMWQGVCPQKYVTRYGHKVIGLQNPLFCLKTKFPLLYKSGWIGIMLIAHLLVPPPSDLLFSLWWMGHMKCSHL